MLAIPHSLVWFGDRRLPTVKGNSGTASTTPKGRRMVYDLHMQHRNWHFSLKVVIKVSFKRELLTWEHRRTEIKRAQKEVKVRNCTVRVSLHWRAGKNRNSARSSPSYTHKLYGKSRQGVCAAPVTARAEHNISWYSINVSVGYGRGMHNTMKLNTPTCIAEDNWVSQKDSLPDFFL